MRDRYLSSHIVGDIKEKMAAHLACPRANEKGEYVDPESGTVYLNHNMVAKKYLLYRLWPKNFLLKECRNRELF